MTGISRLGLALPLVVAAGASAAGPDLSPLVATVASGGAAGFALTRSRAEHDRHWLAAWLALVGGVVVAGVAATLGLALPRLGWLSTGGAHVAGAALVVAGLRLLQHRLPSSRAFDIASEAALAATAVALSLVALAGEDVARFVPVALPVFLDAIAVWLLTRAAWLSGHEPLAGRLAPVAAGLVLVLHLGQAWQPPGTVPTVVPAAAAVGAACVVLLAVRHRSMLERFPPVPARSTRIAPLHFLMLGGAIALPSVVALQFAPTRGWWHLAATVLFPLLVVAHLVRQVQDRASGEYRAQHDSLTGLPNRILFLDRLEVALAQARRTGNRVAVLYLDLDRFKTVNDSLGHEAGNDLLQQVARRLTGVIREEDTVARLGGDEFTVILREVRGPDDARLVADKLLEALVEPFSVGSREVFTGTSIGVSLYPDDGDDVETLLKHADTAMYRAKARRRNGVELYTRGMSARAQLRLALESSLRSALDHEQLTVHYQPRIGVNVVGAPEPRIVGLEALVRWNHPTLGYISPAAFVPIAEESGLITRLGEWVLTAACSTMVRWREEDVLDVPVSVNLSARQFAEVDVEQLVVDALRATGLPPSRLELELTESVVMRDVEVAIALLRRLREVGVRCSIDDFGTGYSGLSYLTRMPIDTLKIDRSFVADIGERDSLLIDVIVALAGSLRLNVVAEGVETWEQVEHLRRLGCDEMQGFLFSHPLDAAGVEALVARWGRDGGVSPGAVAGVDPRRVTEVLLAASDEAGDLVDLDAAHAVLTALSEDATPELRLLASAALHTPLIRGDVRRAPGAAAPHQAARPQDQSRLR